MRTVYKPSDTVRQNTTVATADPDLRFALEANSTYIIRGQVYFRGSAAGDVKHGFSAGGASLDYATGASHIFEAPVAESGTTSGSYVAPWNAALVLAGSTRRINGANGAYWMPMRFALLLKTSSNGGVFSIIWAQNTADAAGEARCLAGSILTYEKLP